MIRLLPIGADVGRGGQPTYRSRSGPWTQLSLSRAPNHTSAQRLTSVLVRTRTALQRDPSR